MNERIAHARHTLLRGADFLGSGLRFPAPADAGSVREIDSRCRARVIGNGLRELDRFLNILLDETMTSHGLKARPDQRNTANKWSHFNNWRGAPPSHERRLRALGPSRNCLFYCAGRINRGDSCMTPIFTAGWPASPQCESTLRRFRVGERLEISATNLAETCAFYRMIATDLNSDCLAIASDGL